MVVAEIILGFQICYILTNIVNALGTYPMLTDAVIIGLLTTFTNYNTPIDLNFDSFPIIGPLLAFLGESVYNVTFPGTNFYIIRVLATFSLALTMVRVFLEINGGYQTYAGALVSRKA